jgi:GDSL-like lipase/acylhydrolase family protein
MAHGALRTGYRAVFGPRDEDPARGWRGVTPQGLPALRMLYVGDCGMRAMEHGHRLRSPLGWPAVVAERLVENGVGFEFSHSFCVLFEDLPDMETLQRHCKLSADPDVIAVQLGASYTRRVIISDTERMMQLRDDVKRRLGRGVWPAYKPLRAWVRVFGRFMTPYNGASGLERFLREVHERWPEADVVVMPPFPRTFTYPVSIPVRDQVDADVRAVAARTGTALLDFDEVLGDDPALRCVSGYNLNARGSGLAGERIADWLLERNETSGGLRDDPTRSILALNGD